MVARTRHPGAARNVVPSMQASHRAGPRVIAPGPAAAGTSPYLRIILREIDHSGSGSPIFWGVFRAALPQLSDAELERVALACGDRGRAVFLAITEAQTAARSGSRARTSGD